MGDANKKKSFWNIVSYSVQQQTIFILDCDVWWKVDFIVQPAQWLDWEEAPKRFPKPNLHQKSHGHYLVAATRLIHYNFLNPGETITSEKYAQKINEIHQNCNACSQYWSTERAQLPNSFPQQYLTTHCTTSTSNVERFGLKSFALSTIFIWPLAHRLPLFQASQQLFAEEMLPQ